MRISDWSSDVCSSDLLLSTLCLARACPLLVAPAMNREMWANPATQRNVAQLRADGIAVLGPASGEQACGETGDGRMLEAHELLADLIAFFQPKVLAGRHVLLTAGPTSEPVDPVRVLSNRSSGKTGYALARAAREAGARVRSEEHTTELQSLMSNPYAVFCLKKKKKYNQKEDKHNLHPPQPKKSNRTSIQTSSIDSKTSGK